jgi:Ca-activated chloride channel family protein
MTIAAAMIAAALSVKILSPGADSFVSGVTMLRAEVEPVDAAAIVSFFVDGRPVCRVARPPYECEWDAGRTIAEHRIRVVAASAEAPETRTVATISTKGIAVAESVDVDLVEVTVTVTDGGSKYVMGLPQRAFRVYEDGRSQAITHFSSENVALDLVLAVDISGSMRESMPKMKSAVKEFLTAVSATDRVTLLGFNDTIFPLARKSTDPVQRVKAVERLASWGDTALYDVIATGINLLGRETGRKAMVVFTDGEDMGSHTSLSDVERRLEASGVTLYVIGEGRALKIDALRERMDRLARSTGGRAIVTEKIDDLRGAFAELLDELSHQYLLGYAPTNSAHDGTLRQLKVEVEGRHRIRAREAYRAPSPRK